MEAILKVLVKMKNITFIQDNTPAKFIRNRSCNFREDLDRQVKSLQTDRQTMCR